MDTESQGNTMKKVGIVLILLGLIGGIFAFKMNTTVEVRAVLEYGPYTSKTTPIHNTGLMDNRKNFLMISGLSVLCGFILFGFGSLKKPKDLSGSMECPYCAEKINKNAKICRFCNHEVQHKEKAKRVLSEEELKTLGIKTSKCAFCGSVFPSAEMEIHKRKIICPTCNNLSPTEH